MTGTPPVPARLAVALKRSGSAGHGPDRGGIATGTSVLPARPDAAAASRAPHCRFCGSALTHLVVDLGMSPPCERYLRADQLDEMEPFYPLRVHVCERCLLVQLQEYVSPEEIFTEYAYFSSYSSSWVDHARRYCEQVLERFGLGPARRPAGRQQRARPGPRPQRLRGRDAAPARALRGRHGGVPASGAAVRGQPVRHHLPRALLVLLAAGRRARLRRSRPGRLRRGGAAHPRGVAAAVPAAPGRRLQAGTPAGGRRGGPRGRGGLRPAGAPPVVRAAGRGHQAQAAQLPDPGQGPWPAHSRLRRARQGQHPAELLRHPLGPARLHGRPQSLQAGALPAGHARAHPRPVADRQDPARLRPRPAVEPAGRGHDPARRGALLGRTLRGPDPRGQGVRGTRGERGTGMKTVLFCGGLGLRLREHGDSVPKPMIPIGYRPILWHIMKYYAHYGHKDFVLCLGYRADVVKQYFLHYDEAVSNDFVLRNGGRDVELLSSDIDEWRITFADTGLHAGIGQRLRAARKYLEGEEVFLASYGDCLTDAPLDELVADFRRRDTVASFVSVQPDYPFSLVDRREDGLVTGMSDVCGAGLWVNGGYFIFRREIFDYLEEGEELVVEPFQRLIKESKLITYPHAGFWAPMDTLVDHQTLERLANEPRPPWAVWQRDELGVPVGGRSG